ncbi:unnamed protein product [Brachionus calyciflorus]|uniref:Uncharacterized protein n=1 Tax=Brachionus calyciflorus TaxID=104777 RepID=A0A814LBS8_9BILA|nr:unnamed protein product [Brachionus calyciflorus]
MNSIIKDKEDLRDYIENLRIKLDHLEKNDHIDKSIKLSKIISYLSSCLHLNGIITDPLTNEKYFISSGELVGGIKSYAYECSKHRPENLYSKNSYNVEKELIKIGKERESVSKAFITALIWPFVSFPVTTGIMIINNSKFKLEYVHSGSGEDCYFFTGNNNAALSFQGKGLCIEPGYTAGFMHTRNVASRNSLLNGYISFRILTDKGNFIVVMAWGVNSGLDVNRAGLNVYFAEHCGIIADIKNFLNLYHHGNGGVGKVYKNVKDIFKLEYHFFNKAYQADGYRLYITE